MKKFLTIALALVLVLAAVPAMAFTGTTSASSSVVPTLSIYLVDYSDNGFFGMATLPTADRGYATNEIVAAVVEVGVPAGATTGNYGALTFSGTNVSLNVTDNAISGTAATLKAITPSAGLTTQGFTWDSTNGILSLAGTSIQNTTSTSANTYKFMFYAKVTADNASLTAKLTDGSGVGSSFGTSPSSLQLVLGGVTYTVEKTYSSSSGGDYTITVGSYTGYTGDTIKLSIDANYKSIGMSINGTPLGVTVGGVLGYVSGSTVVTSSTDSLYVSLMDVYNTIVKGVFGLDYFKIGNYLYDSFFTNFTSASTITATVSIKPWSAYVTVPSEVVVTPPKTGDAAGIVGFVMIALAAAAAVVVKKVRA